MNQFSINRVNHQVRRILPRHLDAENVAIEIIFESWMNNVEAPSVNFIRHRCYDAMRKSLIDTRTSRRFPRSLVTRDIPPDDSDHISKLMRSLSLDERKIIWYRFYQGLSRSEIASKLKLSVNVVREVLIAALFKMRQSEEGEGK